MAIGETVEVFATDKDKTGEEKDEDDNDDAVTEYEKAEFTCGTDNVGLIEGGSSSVVEVEKVDCGTDIVGLAEGLVSSSPVVVWGVNSLVLVVSWESDMTFGVEGQEFPALVSFSGLTFGVVNSSKLALVDSWVDETSRAGDVVLAMGPEEVHICMFLRTKWNVLEFYFDVTFFNSFAVQL